LGAGLTQVELEAGTGDEGYLFELGRWLPRLLEHQDPDLIFFQVLDTERFCVRALKGD
jgi:hypothetical protein